MFSYLQIIEGAKAHSREIERRLQGWAVDLNSGNQRLMSYWISEGGDIAARIIHVDLTGQVDLELIAAHLNEGINAGPLTVKALQDQYMRKVKAASTRHTRASVLKNSSAAIH